MVGNIRSGKYGSASQSIILSSSRKWFGIYFRGLLRSLPTELRDQKLTRYQNHHLRICQAFFGGGNRKLTWYQLLKTSSEWCGLSFHTIRFKKNTLNPVQRLIYGWSNSIHFIRIPSENGKYVLVNFSRMECRQWIVEYPPRRGPPQYIFNL